MSNVDQTEIAKFESIADKWWDPDGEFKPLHDINPLRLNYINERTALAGMAVLDVGCGGGILSEGLTYRGAQVTGIDMGAANLDVAQAHAAQHQLDIDYRHISVEDLAAEMPNHFDVVTCMEMLEHVPDPQAIINACASMAKPGGDVFFSTLNRNPKAYLLAIVGAEYIAKMLPKGTHDYARFIRPAELARCCREAGLHVYDITGISYNPLTRRYKLSRDVDVNYLVHCRRI